MPRPALCYDRHCRRPAASVHYKFASLSHPHRLPRFALWRLDQGVKSGSLGMHMSVTGKRTSVARRINSLGMKTDRPVSRFNSLGVIIPDQERHLP